MKKQIICKSCKQKVFRFLPAIFCFPCAKIKRKKLAKKYTDYFRRNICSVCRDTMFGQVYKLYHSHSRRTLVVDEGCMLFFRKYKSPLWLVSIWGAVEKGLDKGV